MKLKEMSTKALESALAEEKSEKYSWEDKKEKYLENDNYYMAKVCDQAIEYIEWQITRIDHELLVREAVIEV